MMLLPFKQEYYMLMIEKKVLLLFTNLCVFIGLAWW
jgi:hypothetical protein